MFRSYENILLKIDVSPLKLKDAEGPEVVVKMIYKSATDKRDQMRYAVGKPGP